MTKDLRMDLTPEGHLIAYLKHTYKPEQLRALLGRTKRMCVVEEFLPTGGPSAWEMSSFAVDELKRHGLIDIHFFEMLIEDRPGNEVQIRRMAKHFDLVLPGSCSTSIQASRLGEVFFEWSSAGRQPLPRRLKRLRLGEIEDTDLLSQVLYGLDLILGETGLGCTTTLYRLALVALGRATPFICLRGPESLHDALIRGDRDWGDVEGVTSRAVTLVLWDDLPPEAALEIGKVRFERPDLKVVATCGLVAARAISNAHLWDLLPLHEEDRRRLLAQHGLPEDLLATWRAWLKDGAEDVLGNPLFITLASEVGGEGFSPQLTQLVARRVAEALAALGEQAEAARKFLVATSEAWVAGRKLSISRRELKEIFGRFDATDLGMSFEEVLGGLVSSGTLEDRHTGWYSFRHDLYPVVIAAQERGQLEDLRRADQEPEGLPRDCAILVPAFVDPSLPALDTVAPHLDELWLRGLSELAHEAVGPRELERAFRRYLPFQHPTVLLTSIRTLFEAPDMLGTSKAVGLLRGLVYMRSSDPDLLGVLLMVIDQWREREVRSAEPLRQEILRGFERPPVRGPSYAVGSGSSQVWIARHPVTWDEFEAVFPEHQGYPWRGERRLRPRTFVRWPAARLYAELAGGRLPTRDEWMSARDTLGWPSMVPPHHWTVAHLAPTHSRLERDGPGPVDDARLSGDPGRGRVDQLIGNICEWTEDGPKVAPASRWTLGGSYQTTNADDQRLAWHDHRLDLGFRLCWDTPP